MFINDSNWNYGSGSSDEFSRYCKNEGLDSIYILSRIEQNKKTGRKVRKHTGNPWKLLKKTVIAYR